MPRDMYDTMCMCPHTCKVPSICEHLPVPASLSAIQLHMPERSFVVAPAMLVTATFCFHDSALSCSILNETFGMLQQQETLYFRYTNLGLHVQSQLITHAIFIRSYSAVLVGSFLNFLAILLPKVSHMFLKF